MLTGNDPKEGVLVTIPPHRGPVTMSFELHNRHTYSAELVKLKQAYRKYTATIGVLTMDNTLVDRAVVQSEFRTEKDLFDRIGGGAGPGGVKAVAPSGDEFITIELPADVGEQVSILGEKLSVMRPDGVDNFTSAGRPIASISNVMLEYRPGPPPKKAPAKAPARLQPRTSLGPETLACIASADRSMSSSVVDQFDTEIAHRLRVLPERAAGPARALCLDAPRSPARVVSSSLNCTST